MTRYSIEGISEDECRRLLGDMIRIRVFEERCAELYAESLIRGFLHLYIGEEAVATGEISQLGPDDSVLATYRRTRDRHPRACPQGEPRSVPRGASA
jgi:TPP-dependent pyruvate/acetoin dehydrogenase alpha subunit